MFTTRTPDVFVSIPIDDGEKTVEVSLDPHPFIIATSESGTFAKVLTLKEISDMIEALNELKRLAGGVI